MRTWSITLIAVFLSSLMFHLTGYLDLIRTGEIHIVGAIFEAKFMILEIIIAGIGTWLVLGNRSSSMIILAVLFIGVPLYHMTLHARFWLIHGGWIYEGIDGLTLIRYLIKDFVLVLGVPHLIIHRFGKRVDNQLVATNN